MYRKELDIKEITKENSCEKREYQRTGLDEINSWIEAADGEVKEHFMVIRDVIQFKEVDDVQYNNAIKFYNTCKRNELIERALLYAVNRPFVY